MVLHPLSEVVERDKVPLANQFKPGHLKTRSAIRILERNHYPPKVTAKAKALSETIKTALPDYMRALSPLPHHIVAI